MLSLHAVYRTDEPSPTTALLIDIRSDSVRPYPCFAPAVLRRQLLLPRLDDGRALSGSDISAGNGSETRLAIRRLRQAHPSAVCRTGDHPVSPGCTHAF